MKTLALFGGEPVRTKPFPKWPRVTGDIRESLLHTLENDLWGVGSQAAKQFEERFADYHEAKYCISTNSGTSALWVALKAAGVKPGDEVLIPPYTFIATASAVLMANAIPVFVDVDPETFNMDPDLIEDSISEKTKVIMPVHVGGNPAHMDKILAIGEKQGIAVIEDAAQAHGAEWKGKKVGALGLGGIFSFQTSKNMTAGEGGAIVSNNEDYINTCFSYYNCGRVRDGKWYEHRVPGGNFRLNAFSASLLLPQLDTLPADLDLRSGNKDILDKALGQIEGLHLVRSYPETTRSSHHLYLLRYDRSKFNNIARETFFKAMQAEGVYTYAGYPPLYREEMLLNDKGEYPWVEDLNYRDVHCPVTEKLADEEAVWLKQNHLLGTEKDIQDIIDAFYKVTAALKEEPDLFR